MKNMIILAMILTMLVLATAKVFAHGEGRCLIDVGRSALLRNGSWVKITRHLSDAELKRLHGSGYKHGHIKQYYDRDDNPTTLSTAFFDIDFDDPGSAYYHDRNRDYVDCPRNPVNDPEPVLVGFGCDNLRVGTSEICHEWNFYQSRFAGIPVLPDSIETVADLSNYFDELTGGRLSKIALIVNGERLFYPATTELGAVVITPHLGIWVSYDWGIGIVGYPVSGETVALTLPDDSIRVSHMIGFPEIPANYKRLSDLLIDGVVSVRDSVLKNDKPSFSYIYNEHDEYDRLIEVGDAVMVRIRKDVTFDLSSEVASAPMARRHNTLATSWGGLKRMP